MVIHVRFHLTVSEAIEQHPIAVIEINQPMSKSMVEIQRAIMEVIDACVHELRKACSMVDISDFTLENAVFKTFDRAIRRQLDPVWHRLGPRTRQLVHDLKMLRKLLG
jgi:DNA excision repair protein ERCC-4